MTHPLPHAAPRRAWGEKTASGRFFHLGARDGIRRTRRAGPTPAARSGWLRSSFLARSATLARGSVAPISAVPSVPAAAPPRRPSPPTAGPRACVSAGGLRRWWRTARLRRPAPASARTPRSPRPPPVGTALRGFRRGWPRRCPACHGPCSAVARFAAAGCFRAGGRQPGAGQGPRQAGR